MTLGLPEHLARASLSRALASAGHAAGAVCLAAALMVALASVVVDPDPDGISDRQTALIATAMVVVQALLYALVTLNPSVTLTVTYLLGGTAVVFGLTTLVMQPDNGFETTNNAVLAMPRVALLLVGGAGIGSRIAITWAALGWGLGEAASLLGAAIVGGAWAPSVAAAAALALVVVARVYDSLTRSEGRRGTALHRASQQTRELVIRHDYELRAIARLHDTALSHLVAIAAAGSGPVDERLRAAIGHDLTLIVGRDWAAEHAGQSDVALDAAGSATRVGARVGGTDGAGATSPGPAVSPSAAGARTTAESGGADRPRGASAATSDGLDDALAMARASGLTVNLSGSPEALARIGPQRRAALEAAVAQCLVNVARHAGVDDVELAIGPGDGEVTVVIVDSGRGFDPDRVPEDRIGLKTSIRGRVEQEGGRARIWSRPGVGTTVVLSVPEGGA
ncbi:sensor histidine kinase [Agromyces sp. GXS1127]|uniref:sensor histidine kinase n=1 Tax=Agromyces sp. GXS1127 TaxID=3424181 RepID=UPI003D31044E